MRETTHVEQAEPDSNRRYVSHPRPLQSGRGASSLLTGDQPIATARTRRYALCSGASRECRCRSSHSQRPDWGPGRKPAKSATREAVKVSWNGRPERAVGGQPRRRRRLQWRCAKNTRLWIALTVTGTRTRNAAE